MVHGGWSGGAREGPELVSQGLMLNQPAQYPDDFAALGSLVPDGTFGYDFMQIVPDPIYEWEGSPLDTTLYQTEIARRFSLISQAASEVGASGTVAFATWKQGIIRQGGPADVMARRFVVPDTFDPAVDNPFADAHMACDQWTFTDGSNPRYVKGLCVSPATTLSGTSIVAGDCGDELACGEAFPWNDYFDDLAGGIEIASITDWRWCDGSGAIEGCLGDSDLEPGGPGPGRPRGGLGRLVPPGDVPGRLCADGGRRHRSGQRGPAEAGQGAMIPALPPALRAMPPRATVPDDPVGS